MTHFVILDRKRIWKKWSVGAIFLTLTSLSF